MGDFPLVMDMYTDIPVGLAGGRRWEWLFKSVLPADACECLGFLNNPLALGPLGERALLCQRIATCPPPSPTDEMPHHVVRGDVVAKCLSCGPLEISMALGLPVIVRIHVKMLSPTHCGRTWCVNTVLDRCCLLVLTKNASGELVKPQTVKPKSPVWLYLGCESCSNKYAVRCRIFCYDVILPRASR